MHALVFNLIISDSILHVLCNLYSSLQGSNSLVKAVAYALWKLVRVWYVNDLFKSTFSRSAFPCQPESPPSFPERLLHSAVSS